MLIEMLRFVFCEQRLGADQPAPKTRITVAIDSLLLLTCRHHNVATATQS
jgi:hypothetical protein